MNKASSYSKKSRLIRDSDTSGRKSSKIMKSHNSKESMGEHETQLSDNLRLSLRNGKKSILLAEHGIRAGINKRLENEAKGRF